MEKGGGKREKERRTRFIRREVARMFDAGIFSLCFRFVCSNFASLFYLSGGQIFGYLLIVLFFSTSALAPKEISFQKMFMDFLLLAIATIS